MIIYPQMQQPSQPREGMFQPSFFTQQAQPQPGQQTQAPTTEDFVRAYIDKLKQRKALPSLDPGGRVQNVSSQLSDPSNFKSYYDQLNSIRDIGKQQVATAQAQAVAAQIAAQQQRSASSMPSPNVSGSGYKAAAVPSNPKANFQYAQQLAGQFGWGTNDLNAWYQLGMKESGWNNNAQNPTSTAYGIGQFLNSTWAGVGIPKTSDPYTQVLAMARYIKNRYGSPSAALAFHLSHNWY